MQRSLRKVVGLVIVVLAVLVFAAVSKPLAPA
jgi:hypothetical protein